MDIEALRTELGCKTIAELSRRLGISNSYLHDLHAKRRGITFRFAAAVDRERGHDELVPALVNARSGRIAA